MQRRGLDALRLSFAQSVQVPVGRFKLGLAHIGFFTNELLRRDDIAGHENSECGLESFANPLVKSTKLGRSFRRELITPLDLLRGEFAQILVDNIADMLE